MDLLRKHIFKIRTPFRNFLIRNFGGLSQFSGQGNLVEVFAIRVRLREVLTKRHIILR